MEIPCSQESPKSLIKNLVEAVDTEYSRQNSTPTPLIWPQIQILIDLFRRFENLKIIGQVQQKIFIEALLKYVELVMGFVSSYEDTEYRKQRNYASTCLTFIPDIFKDLEFRNIFVKEATVKMIDLLTYGTFNLVSKRSLLTMYNDIAGQSKKQVRIEVARSITYLMYQLVDCLSTHGDFVIQSDMMETLFRIFGNQIRNNDKIVYGLLPGSEDLGNSLITDISIQNFDADVRRWLNKFNENSALIFSIACKKVMFGSNIIPLPEDMDSTWVDFNQKEPMLGFYTKGASPDSWNRLIVIAKDVRKVEVKRPLGAKSEITVSIQMSKSCISEERGMQPYYNNLEKQLKLSIFNKEKDKITKLISTVLPQVFGDAFSHTSARIAAKPKNVYKPLPIKISKRKSCASDVSIATSVSRSKSDAASVEVKLSSVIPERKLSLPVNSDSRKSTKGAQLSRVQRATSLNDVSMGSITDFTKLSCRSDPSSDHVSIITSENLDIFLPSKPTSPIMSDSEGDEHEEELMVQDNIVTSSHGEEKIEILSGRCSGRSADYSRLVHGSTGFHPSEVFSSSPVKISQQKNSQDISSIFSGEDVIERVEQKIKNNVQGPKISTLISQEDMLDEEFETAVEDIEQEYFKMERRCVEENKVSCIRNLAKEQENVNESSDKRAKGNQKDKKDMATANSGANNKVDKMWTRQQAREATKKEDERVEELHVEDRIDSDMETAKEAPEIVQNNFDKDLDKPVEVRDVPPLLATTEKAMKEIVAVASTTPNIITAALQESVSASNNTKNVPFNVFLDNEDVCITLIQDKEFFTEDLYEGDTEENKKIMNSKEVTQEHNSEDVFSRPTQVVSPQNDDQFTDLSLAVNVGIPENQFSEDVLTSKKEVCHQDLARTEPHENMEKNKVDLMACDIANVNNKENLVHFTKTALEENKENIIDLTVDEDDDDEDDKETGVLKKKKTTKIRDRIKVNQNEKASKNKPLLNTPELLGILDDGNPLDKSLREITQKKITKPADNKVQHIAAKNNLKIKSSFVIKDNYTVKESIVINEKPKTIKKKPRTLIKTGTKRFELEEMEEIGKVKNDLGTNKELLEERDQVKSRGKEPEACLSEKESVPLQEATDSEGISKENNNIQGTNETVEMGKQVVCEEDVPQDHPLIQDEKHHKVVISQLNNDSKDESSNSSPELEVAFEFSSENIDSMDTFDKLKKSEEGKSLLNKNQTEAESPVIDTLNVSQNQLLAQGGKKELAVLLTQRDFDDEKDKDTTSNSESELAPEINMENVEYIDTFNQLIQKKTESGISKSTDTIKPIKTKDPSINFEEQIATGMNIKIGDEVDTVDKMAEKGEDNNKLSGFLLKKSTRRLVESQEEDAGNNLEKEINTAVDIKPTEPVISPQYQEIQGKVSNIVKKGKKGKRRKQPKKQKRKVISNRIQQACELSSSDLLKDAENKIEDKPNEEETIPDLDTSVPAKSDIGITEKGGFEKSNEVVKLHDNIIKETVDKDLYSQDNEISEEKLVPEDVSVTAHSDDLEPNQETNKRDKVVPAKTPDTSPEVSTHQEILITSVAQIHRTADDSPPLKSDKEVKKSKRLAEKRKRSSESLSQECAKLEQELRQSYKNDSDRQKRKSENIHEIVEESAPIFKRTRSNDKLKGQSPDDFDKLIREEISLNNTYFNKSKMNTTSGNRSRKLYNQGNYSYLDELPDITEQKTPDLDETPIPLVKGTKLTKQKKAQLRKEKQKTAAKTVVDQSKRKTEKSPKEKTTKESAKPRTKPQPKRGKKKEFAFNTTTDFMSLDELFNKTCRSLGNNTFVGFHSLHHRPMDIVARFAPQNSSSDESPVGLTKLRNNKNVSPELPKTIEEPKTPSTPEYSFPDFEIEPYYKKVKAPQKKINILHDILIKPKRPSRELINGNCKRRKLNREEDVESIPVQPLPDDQFKKDLTVSNQSPKEVRSNEAEAVLDGMVNVFKYIITLLERRNNPESLQKLNALIETMKHN